MPGNFCAPAAGKPAPVWLDCDPGHDDALALILAAHSTSLHLLGVSTVHGNQEVEKVTTNALKILHLCGRTDVDVVQGQAAPLLRPPKYCPQIHGESGLDGPHWPMQTKGPVEGKAVNVMFQKLWECYVAGGGGAEVVTLVCTGSLTNAALLLTVYPELKDFLQIIFMGPVAEFNIQCDPEAAKIVLLSGIPLVMIPLEVSHTALVTPEVMERIRTDNPTPFRNIISEVLLFFAHTYKEVFSFPHPPLHDPCTLVYLIAPHLFEVDHLRVDVEVTSELSAGQTVCDVWKQSGKPPNVIVARSMDVSAFWKIMVQAIDDANVKAQRLHENESSGVKK